MSVYIPQEKVAETLATLPQTGKRLLEPLKALSLSGGVPMHILEDIDIENPPEIHMKEADLWIGIEGEVHFVVGGEIIDPHPQTRADGSENHDEITGSRIEGGKAYVVRPGDILHIPAGVPHAHGAKGAARMYIIKVPLVA